MAQWRAGRLSARRKATYFCFLLIFCGERINCLMEKTYHLDLKTVLEYLWGKSAILRTTIALAKNRQPCQGYLFLRGGNVIQSYVLNQAGVLLLSGQPAYAQLSSASEWLVRIDTDPVIEQEMFKLVQQYRLPFNPSNSNPSPSAPQQKRPLNDIQLQMFSPKQSLLLRTVFALINGERTFAQIKMQLNFPSESIEEALTILRSLGYIE